MDLREIGLGVIDWIHLTDSTDHHGVNTVMNLSEWVTGGFSRRIKLHGVI
jgi:hypothetical protein